MMSLMIQPLSVAGTCGERQNKLIVLFGRSPQAPARERGWSIRDIINQMLRSQAGVQLFGQMVAQRESLLK